jgi:hypothetical protein
MIIVRLLSPGPFGWFAPPKFTRVQGADIVMESSQCAVKGAEPQREINPPGNWIAPPGSNRSGGGGNKTVGASGEEGRVRRLGESVGRNASEC